MSASSHWIYLVYSWIAITSVLVILLAYRNVLSTREDDQLFLDKEEKIMMGSEQRALIRRMHRLNPLILTLALLSGALLLAIYAVWVWNIYFNVPSGWRG